MSSEKRTLFVIINDKRLEISEPNCSLYHDQWFIREKFTDDNMARRFLDMHVRGYYKDGQIFFYRSPTFIYDDQDIAVMEKFLDPLVIKLKALNLLKTGETVALSAGRGNSAHLLRKVIIQ